MDEGNAVIPLRVVEAAARLSSTAVRLAVAISFCIDHAECPSNVGHLAFMAGIPGRKFWRARAELAVFGLRWKKKGDDDPELRYCWGPAPPPPLENQHTGDPSQCSIVITVLRGPSDARPQ